MSKSQLSPKILIVDDKPQNLYALERILRKLEAEIIRAATGLEALSLTLNHDFCLAIVDVQMPGMDGYELVELWRGNVDTANLPVIFVSAIYSDEYHHRKGYDAGAVDFLSKPFVPEILLSKAQVFLDLYEQRIKLQELVNQVNSKNKILENEIKQRQQADAALRQANADKDKLFSIISHDLRNPFQTLLGNAEWMLEQIDNLTKEDLHSIAGSIHRSAQAAYNLLANLLTWSQLQRGRIEYDPVPVELSELAENTIALLGEMAQDKQIRLVHTIETNLFVQADEYMIDTVVRNITANALKFTPAGGQVTLSAHYRNGNSSDGGPSDEASPDGEGAEWVEVTVSDTGVGIKKSDINKLFKIDVHHTTPGTAHESGTGLGLILCQEMVQKNGGRIWIDSEEGQGTQVTFTVPTKPHQADD